MLTSASQAYGIPCTQRIETDLENGKLPSLSRGLWKKLEETFKREKASLIHYGKLDPTSREVSIM